MRSFASLKADREYHRKPERREAGLEAAHRYRKTRKGQETLANNRQARGRRNREIINETKNQPCADCGRRFPVCAMDFDHVRGEKRYNIGYLASVGTLTMLLDEIAKCEVVCACCHRVRTVLRAEARRETKSVPSCYTDSADIADTTVP